MFVPRVARRIRYFTFAAPRKIELAALRAGLRQVVKLEDVSVDKAEQLRWPRGVRVRHSTPFVKHLHSGEVRSAGPGRWAVNVYASWGDAFERLYELEQEDPARHAQSCGELLGYPRCCVAAFVASRDHTRDDDLIVALARVTPSQPLWRLNVLCDCALISFYPCRFDCPFAEREAQRLETVLSPRERARVRHRLARAIRFRSFANLAVKDGSVWRPNILADSRYAKRPDGLLLDFRQ